MRSSTEGSAAPSPCPRPRPRDAALLVLGSRAPGRVGGLLAGSVAHAVLAR
ncbi:universal stress protein, partial [Streptomyces nigra]